MSDTRDCRNMTCLGCLWCRIKLFFNPPSNDRDSSSAETQPPPQPQAQSAATPNSLHGNHSDQAEAVAETQPEEVIQPPIEEVEAETEVKAEVEQTASSVQEKEEFDDQSDGTLQTQQASLLSDDKDPVPDQLTRISGIGPVIEKKLHNMGIVTFAQIAAFDEEQIASVNAQLSFKGRIEREEWVAQAKKFLEQ